VRTLMRQESTVSLAVAVLQRITTRAGHEFWPDDASYVDVDLTGVIGHRQVTDAYLATQARRHGARLATFDRGLAALHRDVVELVPI